MYNATNNKDSSTEKKKTSSNRYIKYHTKMKLINIIYISHSAENGLEILASSENILISNNISHCFRSWSFHYTYLFARFKNKS